MILLWRRYDLCSCSDDGSIPPDSEIQPCDLVEDIPRKMCLMFYPPIPSWSGKISYPLGLPGICLKAHSFVIHQEFHKPVSFNLGIDYPNLIELTFYLLEYHDKWP
ncbi:hypothetical protein Tco_0694252 [Tanacetum coccineum]